MDKGTPRSGIRGDILRTKRRRAGADHCDDHGQGGRYTYSDRVQTRGRRAKAAIAERACVRDRHAKTEVVTTTIKISISA